MQISLVMQKALLENVWKLCKTACCLDLEEKLTSEAEDALGSGDDGDDDDDDDDQGDDDNRDDGPAAGFWKVKCQRKVLLSSGKCAASWWLSGTSLSLNKQIIRLKL